MTTPTENTSTMSNGSSGKRNTKTFAAAILVQAIGSLGPLAYLAIIFFAGVKLPGDNGSGLLFFPLIFLWSLVNAVNFFIELKIGRFEFRTFFKKFVWVALIWVIPWTVFYLISETDTPQNSHSFEYEVFVFGQAFLLWEFILLTAALWPLAAAFFKKPSFKRELAVLIISIQLTILLSIGFFIF
ncbi:hypothetical protein SAMN05720468_10960 [Fibrobacter sp. UWEL]|nr:hypothetical protein SAMN05720468_10960 [Fibrobacter sp. UWEL]